MSAMSDSSPPQNSSSTSRPVAAISQSIPSSSSASMGTTGTKGGVYTLHWVPEDIIPSTRVWMVLLAAASFRKRDEGLRRNRLTSCLGLCECLLRSGSVVDAVDEVVACQSGKPDEDARQHGTVPRVGSGGWPKEVTEEQAEVE